MKMLVALVVMLTTAGLWWARRHLVHVTVAGQSMRPTLDEGDVVLARRTPPRSLRPRQIVVAERPCAPQRWNPPTGAAAGQITGDAWMIKRIAALRLDDGPAQGDAHLRSTLPPGTVFLLGDNLPASQDSRGLGPWPVDRVLGVVVGRVRRAPGSAPAADATTWALPGAAR
ncbi:MAG TPA: S26 family signal peptidase [Euzebyales bacterium]|nr:S26 family signal peptidase [Euzebyales bacterium]